MHRFREARFDLLNGVQTRGNERLSTLGVETTNDIHRRKYEGIDPKLFRRIVSGLGIDYRQFTFIDLGSGKGRAVMLASRFPFRRVLGIEFSQRLFGIAKQNLQRWGRPIQIALSDAGNYAFPAEPTVLFFYNSFGGDVMLRVLENIKTSLRESPRDVYLVYVFPDEEPPLHDLLRAHGFEVEKSSAWWRVYRAV